jgi:ArsR family transcriptional regulator, arsenate/arsenite/antimonite-responsive transcriptional repressor / arsenate reductase (thioredoxin)
LARSDQRGQELGQLLQRPQNLISYHLKQLLTHKLVSERRSAADGRDIYFSLRLDQLRQLYPASGLALHPGMGDTGPEAQVLQPIANQPQARVLFLCTHNSARSQMAEALLRHHRQGQIDVHSAGNEPSEIHPLAIRQGARDRQLTLDEPQDFEAIPGQGCGQR